MKCYLILAVLTSLAVTLAIAAPALVAPFCPLVSMWVLFGQNDEDDEE